MAAPVKNMVGVSADTSSSSDDEALRRCQEAVWDTRPHGKEDSKVKPSRRVVVAAHEHDGNELQVSQGFRTHVAKKLGHLLDSCISETHSESFCVEAVKCEDAVDEGFLLFSTSVPGERAEEPPAPVRRRPPQSSSDSDSEMESRLREAAVSLKDLFDLTSTQPLTSAEPEKQKKKKKKMEVDGEDGSSVKKKRRRDQEEEGRADGSRSADCEQEESGQEQTQGKQRKKKKKKKREGNTMEGASN